MPFIFTEEKRLKSRTCNPRVDGESAKAETLESQVDLEELEKVPVEEGDLENFPVVMACDGCNGKLTISRPCRSKAGGATA